MTSLLNQVLNLPREEQLELLAALVDNLQAEETPIPEWQLQAARAAQAEAQAYPENVLSEKAFWEAVDAQIEGLKQS